MSLCRGTAQPYHWIRQRHEKDTQNHCRRQKKDNRRAKNPVGLILILFASSPCHQSRDRHIQCEKEGKPYKFGLSGQSHSRHRIGAKRADHKRIHQPCEGHKKGLHNGRPCHIEGDTYVFSAVSALLFPWFCLRHDRPLLICLKISSISQIANIIMIITVFLAQSTTPLKQKRQSQTRGAFSLPFLFPTPHEKHVLKVFFPPPP